MRPSTTDLKQQLLGFLNDVFNNVKPRNERRDYQVHMRQMKTVKDFLKKM